MTRTSKTNDKTIGLCSICEKYYNSKDYTVKPLVRGRDPVIVCKHCNNEYADNQ